MLQANMATVDKESGVRPARCPEPWKQNRGPKKAVGRPAGCPGSRGMTNRGQCVRLTTGMGTLAIKNGSRAPANIWQMHF
ncbi:hypothetical protein [Heyndrickxia coagulans]|uniref:hypothetical protein n=1 Tax=Heyndrickxia coagulans TaxID=1398 RepID=UPI000490C780|nr:hypothetical protein [Heyndrickxia coagulans]MCR2845817.1 hypothetical protein [Heyndrickxia coagulans]RGR88216.1 hypothetical protein DWY22_02510 [Heyndrickxia coagulans]RGS00315.1 hypothetical protein DWY16_01650 [Heyndrickxia coagulans]